MIRRYGERALLVELDGDAAAAARRIAGVVTRLEQAGPPTPIRSLIPGLRSLMVETDGDLGASRELVEEALSQSAAAPSGRTRTIPVCYDGADLGEVAALLGLAVGELIERHAAGVLTVLFLGFAPGFPYLGELPPDLAVPRLSTPRTSTAAGSVAIAGRMTGIYPTSSPGGWRVIGFTPLRLFDPSREPPAYLAAGDVIRFRSVTRGDLSEIDPEPPDW